jgi:hypothetical protein
LFENVTSTLSNSDTSFNIGTFFLSQLMSVILILLTVFLTVSYTEYRKEKRNFESIMEGFGIELAIIRTEIDTLKLNSEILLKSLNQIPRDESLPLLIFPKYSFESYKTCLSSGAGKYIPREVMIQMSHIRIQLDNLLFLQAHYEATYPIFFNKELMGENYYRDLNYTLNELINAIEVFHRECDNFKGPRFPSFFTLILHG